MADCCTPRKKLCCCVLLFFLVAGITGGAIGIYKWHYSGLNRWHGTGSTANFQKLIQERCDTYTQPIWQGSSRNCQAIRQAFMSAFISKDPCKATKEDYKPLMDLAPPTVPCGQHVFWSKTKELAHQYAKKWHLMTLEDTLLGYLADNLSWCGEPGSSEARSPRSKCRLGRALSEGSRGRDSDSSSFWCLLENLAHGYITPPSVSIRTWLSYSCASPQHLLPVFASVTKPPFS
ncbi:ADP-ribosyl cyclase/cyclic ADP-ribose hydrolase 1 isoform X5 [Bubalus bubalis]|uniref:ADP-ribosyl cyclase/cyclic ADP-ribose hydrolase 1 isoform X5 n=1 Tax=Bubalus bubalis TaxID=89462 RepID=UPI001E1B8B0B|nr:ADP-ribosyl cyclase/cyclic ADP-ribose hydrolase 1 isoform X5 [Bubalus bubalis]